MSGTRAKAQRSERKKALALAALGFAVFPVRPLGGRKPKAPYTEHGHLEATTSAPATEAAWSRHPDALVGVACGASGVVVLDIDVKPDKDGFASLRAADIVMPDSPWTRPSISGTGGVHVYLAEFPEVVMPNGAADLHLDGEKRPGVDRRSGSSYVVWSGDVPDARPAFPKAPEWLVAARGGGKGAASTADVEQFDGTVGEWLNDRGTGKPDATMQAAVGRIPRGDFGRAELFCRLVEIVSLGAEGHPGARKALNELRDEWLRGEWDTPDNAREFDTSRTRAVLAHGAKTAATVTTIEAGEKPKKLKPHRFDELMRREFPPQGWVVQDMVPEGTSLLVSAPKMGKSLLLLAIALAAATGRDAFGGIPTGDPRPVLILDLESGERRLHSRVIAQGWDEFGKAVFHLDAATAVVTLERFMRKHRGRRPLVILDTLAAVMTDRGDRTQQYKHEYDSLKRLQALTAADPGSAILIAHHTRKMESSDPLQMASGTNGLTGAVDTIFVLTRPDRMRTDGVLSRVSRDVEDAEYELRLVCAQWAAIGGSAEEAQRLHAERERERELNNLGPLAGALLMIVQNAEGAALSVETIFARYDGASDREAVAQALRRLERKRHITKLRRGVYMMAAVSV